MKDRVGNTIKTINHGEIPGSDNIPIEIYDELTELNRAKITEILIKIYDTREITSNICRSQYLNHNI